jgi:hypothetical protein
VVRHEDSAPDLETTRFRSTPNAPFAGSVAPISADPATYSWIEVKRPWSRPLDWPVVAQFALVLGAYYHRVLKRFQTNIVVLTLGALIAVFAALGVLKTFLTDTAPWIADAAGGLGFAILAAVALMVAVFYGYQYVRYRAATKKLMWFHLVEKGGQSDEVIRGAASADRFWGDKTYREVLHLPTEDEYR